MGGREARGGEGKGGHYSLGSNRWGHARHPAKFSLMFIVSAKLIFMTTLQTEFLSPRLQMKNSRLKEGKCALVTE